MSPSVLHVNDAAFTAARMIAEAARRGQEWHLMPKAAPDQLWPGMAGQIRRAMVGGRWVVQLAVAARRHDIVHVHSASTLAHSRLGAPRYVVHCHGTDVRSAQYDLARRSSIVEGLRRAEAVFYSTPDLAEHLLVHRPDAVHVPVPIDVDAVPAWNPAPARQQVVFASRWSADKGVETQLALARGLADVLDERTELVGLDWGPRAGEAARLGVRLVRRDDHASYLRLLAGAQVVIGQAAGILAASELEALAVGAPLVVPVQLPLYSAPPVYGGSLDEGIAAVVALLAGELTHDPDAVRDWARRTHGVSRAVDTVDEVYRAVLAGRA